MHFWPLLLNLPTASSCSKSPWILFPKILLPLSTHYPLVISLTSTVRVWSPGPAPDFQIPRPFYLLAISTQVSHHTYLKGSILKVIIFSLKPDFPATFPKQTNTVTIRIMTQARDLEVTQNSSLYRVYALHSTVPKSLLKCLPGVSPSPRILPWLRSCWTLSWHILIAPTGLPAAHSIPSASHQWSILYPSLTPLVCSLSFSAKVLFVLWDSSVALLLQDEPRTGSAIRFPARTHLSSPS